VYNINKRCFTYINAPYHNNQTSYCHRWIVHMGRPARFHHKGALRLVHRPNRCFCVVSRVAVARVNIRVPYSKQVFKRQASSSSLPCYNSQFTWASSYL
jgi:hypothetical protein